MTDPTEQELLDELDAIEMRAREIGVPLAIAAVAGLPQCCDVHDAVYALSLVKAFTHTVRTSLSPEIEQMFRDLIKREADTARNQQKDAEDDVLSAALH